MDWKRPLHPVWIRVSVTWWILPARARARQMQTQTLAAGLFAQPLIQYWRTHSF